MPTLTPTWWNEFLSEHPNEPTAAAIRGATEIMPKLVDENTPAPRIYAGADGSLLLEWRPPNLKFKIGFAADGHLITLKDDPLGQGEWEYDVDAKNIENLRRAMLRLKPPCGQSEE